MADTLTIDYGMLHSAIQDDTGQDGPKCKGFLNRQTGEIAFLTETREEAAMWWGEDAAKGVVGNRAAVENCPTTWLEIPKTTSLPVHHEHWCERRTTRPRQYHTPCTCGAENDNAKNEEEEIDQFIADFLKENGIVATLR